MTRRRRGGAGRGGRASARRWPSSSPAARPLRPMAVPDRSVQLRVADPVLPQRVRSRRCRHVRPLSARDPGRDRRRPGGRGPAPDGAAVRLRAADRPRAALRGHRPRARRPGTGPVRRAVDRPRPRRAEGRRRVAAAAAAGPRVRLGEHRMDRRRRQRPRCRLPVALRRRSGQRRARLLRGATPRAAGPTGRSCSTVSVGTIS